MPRTSLQLLRRRMGNELRRLRDEAGMTSEGVAAALGWHKAKVSRIELAKVATARPDLAKLLDLYQALPEERASLNAMLPDTQEAFWWKRYSDVIRGPYADFIALESEAVEELEYHPVVVPGLLQTREYARAIITSGPYITDPDDAESLVEVRAKRAELLTEDDPISLSVVLLEGALYMRAGGRDVHRQQLNHLLELGALANVRIHIVPFSHGVGGQTSFTILHFADPDDLSVAFTEYQGGLLMRDGERDVRRYQRMFAYLRDNALSPEASAALIKKWLEEN